MIKKGKKGAGAVLIAVILGACSSKPPIIGYETEEARRAFHCAGWRVIYASEADTPRTLAQIYEHNLFFEMSGCGSD